MREYMEQLQAALILGWASIALGLWVQGLDFQNAQNKQVFVPTVFGGRLTAYLLGVRGT